jgi:hypothetical protein
MLVILIEGNSEAQTGGKTFNVQRSTFNAQWRSKADYEHEHKERRVRE